DVCKEVECGRGKCKPSINGTLPFYICECDPGWKQTFSDKDDHAHLKFLPCIVPNCSMNNVCSAAPSPAQEKASDTDQSAFDSKLCTVYAFAFGHLLSFLNAECSTLSRFFSLQMD
ncbi:hypothetical protein Gogos_011361, partial [Gossypium gossypioides]|nr:hypothetical protein [Gossypium gossypioides]